MFEGNTPITAKINLFWRFKGTMTSDLSSHMAKASFTRVGNSADSPQAFLKLSPAAGHEAEILEG
jgi:hypothetical protein